ncbi:MAG: hypothetical protein NVS4B9_35650 [Ktedonobacteraceae bacterium]
MHQQRAGFFGPNAGLLAARSKDRMGHFPHVLLGMLEVDNLHGPRKVLSHHLPDPGRPIS